MGDVLEQLQFSVGTLAENWCGEWFHDFLDCNGRAGKLVLCRAVQVKVIRTDGDITEANMGFTRRGRMPLL